MPIKMICEKRHHLGEEDGNYPAVFCDVCEKRIVDAAGAGYYYKYEQLKNDEDYYDLKSDVYFIHHDCYFRMKHHYTKNGHFFLETQFGGICSENIIPSLWGNLPAFPIFMGRNLNDALMSLVNIISRL